MERTFLFTFLLFRKIGSISPFLSMSPLPSAARVCCHTKWETHPMTREVRGTHPESTHRPPGGITPCEGLIYLCIASFLQWNIRFGEIKSYETQALKKKKKRHSEPEPSSKGGPDGHHPPPAFASNLLSSHHWAGFLHSPKSGSLFVGTKERFYLRFPYLQFVLDLNPGRLPYFPPN